MASLFHALPEHIRVERNSQVVIAYVRTLKLPSRYARSALQAWGEGSGVTLAPADYLQVIEGKNVSTNTNGA